MFTWGLLLTVIAVVAPAQTLTGRWDGTITIAELKVPFSMHFEGTGDALKGSFYKGEERVASTRGSFDGSSLRLTFSQFGTDLNAKLVDGMLKGTYGAHRVEASAYCTCSYEGEAGPDISGAWDMSSGGEKTQLVIRRKGEDTFGSLASIGPHTGRFDGLLFTLNHFDGAKASVLELTPLKDGAMEVVWKEPGVAVRKYRAAKR